MAPALQLVRLKCHQIEDRVGSYEAYIKVHGAVVWGPQRIIRKKQYMVSPGW
jgi:hypothetical protein